MAAVIKTIGINGILGYVISVQAKTLAGMSSVSIVGLADQAVKESRDRIESAFDHLCCKFPSKKIIINLAPSNVKKRGTGYDLAMVIALLIESGQLIPSDVDKLSKTIFLGETGLSGELNPVAGILPMVAHAAKEGYENIVLSADSLEEASLVRGVELIGFHQIEEVFLWVQGKLNVCKQPVKPREISEPHYPDFSDVLGHNEVLEYVLAAAAGNHNLLMIGPPGCGKSMIAKRIGGILPSLSEDEKLELMSIQSVAGILKAGNTTIARPFRTPHYNTSSSAIVGGGTYAMPGEISLAHHGILFLDELPEFSPKVIDALRQPLEDGVVTVARVSQTNTFPANFMLVAAMNPCKCGHFGTGRCICKHSDVLRYRSRVSGPIYDRLDVQKYLPKVNIFQHETIKSTFSTAEMKAKVKTARDIQTNRFKKVPGIFANAQMGTNHIKIFCEMEPEATSSFRALFEKMEISARAYNKILCVARTFADLESAPKIRKKDIVSAMMARDLEREKNTISR